MLARWLIQKVCNFLGIWLSRALGVILVCLSWKKARNREASQGQVAVAARAARPRRSARKRDAAVSE